MKEYTVGYWIGAYYYESVVRTYNSDAVFLWVETLGGYNSYIVKEVEVDE